jgi:hypothetical protein
VKHKKENCRSINLEGGGGEGVRVIGGSSSLLLSLGLVEKISIKNQRKNEDVRRETDETYRGTNENRFVSNSI